MSNKRKKHDKDIEDETEYFRQIEREVDAELDKEQYSKDTCVVAIVGLGLWAFMLLYIVILATW